jgi:hypothetical protein
MIYMFINELSLLIPALLRKMYTAAFVNLPLKIKKNVSLSGK